MSKYVIANWKMKLGISESIKLAQEFVQSFGHGYKEVVVCPEFISLPDVEDVFRNSEIKLGAQDCHWEDRGAYTGEVSVKDLKELGCLYVILGHSERRQFLKETYRDVNKKVRNVLEEGLIPILCIGETDQERKGQKTEMVLQNQLKEGLMGIDIADVNKIVIAYEPIWAIGTGNVISAQNIEEAHKHIRKVLEEIFGQSQEKISIIYGGSVDSKNVQNLSDIANVDGFLVGTASLKTEEFNKIIQTVLK